MPLPDSEIVVGLFTALLVTVTEPVRAPAAVGVKVTLIVQLAPTARVVPQLFVCAKSPLAVMELIVAELVPLFDSVVDWAAVVEPTTVDANARLAGLALSAGPGAVPVPLSATETAPETSVLTVSVPLREPAAAGLNVTVTVQDPPAAMLVPQVLVCEKSPVIVTDDTAAAVEPLLETVTVCGALVVPVVCEPKLSAVGDAETPTGGGGFGAGHGPQ
jgi:hypothetical protein